MGQDAIVVGISQTLGTRVWSGLGTVRWIPRMAMSEQCTAPHMFRQQARAMRTWEGRLMVAKYPCSSSMTAFTGPEASVAGVWQWTQPWVWTMLVTECPVPPTG